MLENIDNDTAKEVLTILGYCSNDIIKNIPNKIFEKLTTLAATSEKDFYVDKTKNLSQQNISENCRNIISFLYFMYVLDDKQKKEFIDDLLD